MAANAGIVIVGGGQAGGEGAIALREGGYVGPVTIVGDEPHPPYERPPLSKALLLGEASVESTYLRGGGVFAERDIAVRAGARVAAIDRAGKGVTLSDGSGLAYDKLLLATGAVVRKLPLPGADLAGVFYLRTIADALAIRARLTGGATVVVVGGGYIGLEVAASARKRGANAVVVEVADRIMNRVVAPELSAYFTDVHRGHGVDIRTKTTVKSIDGDKAVRAVSLSTGETISAAVVVIGVGIAPDTALAASAGLAVENGIKVDEFAATSDPDVFAAGDVASHWNPLLGRRLRLESWQNAQNQAIAAAKAMLGQPTPYGEVPWFWSDQYDLNLQLVGAPLAWDHVVKRDGGDPQRFTLFYLAGGKLVAANCVNNARDIRPARQLIAKGTPLAADELGDPAVKMQDLVTR
jgi:NADPH-dependent 2,4-dienoyl-CoA reductase/sulfur reductase-like enzyme